MTKTQGNFKLRVIEGEFTDSQIIVMLGENGTGKTTFIRMLVLLFFFLTEIFRTFLLPCNLAFVEQFICLAKHTGWPIET